VRLRKFSDRGGLFTSLWIRRSAIDGPMVPRGGGCRSRYLGREHLEKRQITSRCVVPCNTANVQHDQAIHCGARRTLMRGKHAVLPAGATLLSHAPSHFEARSDRSSLSNTYPPVLVQPTTSFAFSNSLAPRPSGHGSGDQPGARVCWPLKAEEQPRRGLLTHAILRLREALR
jgi:hypothetical protein